jgi:nucleoside-diphosphate-sugar epimerase
MKIIVIGTTGTIGVEVAKALSAGKHEVVGASRNGEFKVISKTRPLSTPCSIRFLVSTR